MTTTEHPNRQKTDQFAAQFEAALQARIDGLEDRFYRFRAVATIALVALLVALALLIALR